jgi:glycosyltransferase involved in cell wall biosynthesis
VPLRVLHLTSVESANYHLNSLAEELHPNRLEMRAATLGGPGGFVDALRGRGVEARALGRSSRIALPWMALRCAALVTRSGAQIVHGHLFEPALVAALASRLTRRPLVLTRHHSDAVHRLSGRIKRFAYLSVESFVNRTARHIIAPARMVERILVEREGVAPQKVTVIPYPQNPSRFAGLRPPAEVRNELGASGRILVTVSRLHPEKGLHVLLEAFAKLPQDLQLYVVGTGPDRERLLALSTRLGVADRTRLVGWRDDALSILAAADLVVHPSFHEALPSAVIEALALARPIVASDVSGVRDILGEQAEYGRVVPSGDVSALASAIAETLADLACARAAASAGRTRLLEYTRPDRVAAAHLECYRSVRRQRDATS